MKKSSLIIVFKLLFVFSLYAQSFVADSAWNQQTPDSTDNFHSVFFTDSLRGWIAGEAGIQASVDGGSNWQFIKGSIDSNQRILDFYTIDARNMWMIVEEDTLGNLSKRDNKVYHMYHSSDSAASWQKQYTSSDTYFKGSFFLNDTLGWMFGSAYSILKTSDGGSNWIIVYTDTLTGFIKDCYFLDELRGFAVGDNSTFLKTEDGGMSWSKDTALPAYASLNTVFPVNDEIIWTAGSLGRIFFSVDGGNTWTLKQLEIADDVFDLYFKNNKTGWAASANGKLHYTTTGDTTWNTSEYSSENLYDIFFLDEDIGWITGSKGMILKTTDGGGEVNIEETQAVFLSKPPFPNPVRDKLRLQFENPEETARLRLIDLAGKSLKTGILEQGMREIVLDVQDLPAGFYFLQISDKEKARTFKILKK